MISQNVSLLFIVWSDWSTNFRYFSFHPKTDSPTQMYPPSSKYTYTYTHRKQNENKIYKKPGFM